jgi:hypothetical protein
LEKLRIAMTASANADPQDALSEIIKVLGRLDDETRSRIFKAAGTFYGLGTNGGQFQAPVRPSFEAREPSFSDRPGLSAKEFLFQKQPKTDVERVACLAYYLTHYRSTPHFKTVDISNLNTEAAQIKFSNTAVAVNNASLTGLLVAAGKGNKQISALGERFVEALPDRVAAKEVLSGYRARRSRKRTAKHNDSDFDE